MREKILRRGIAILVLTLAGLYVVLIGPRLPEAKDVTSWTKLKQNLAHNINLGLDLRGGSHLVMQVQTSQAIQNLTKKNVEVAKGKLQEKGIAFTSVDVTGGDQFTVTVPDPSKAPDVTSELNSDLNTGSATTGGWKAAQVGNKVVYQLSQDAQNQIRENATDQAMKVIEQRINAFGVTEPTIQRQGSNSQYEILLEMPGVEDPERIKNTLNADSNLELREVPKGTTDYPTKDAAEAAMRTQPGGPDKLEVLPLNEGNRSGWMIVARDAIVTGIDMRDAQPRGNQYGGDSWIISFSLTPDGAKRFGDWTGAHVGDQMAIVLNNEIKSAPNIKSKITDQGQIEGNFTQQSAEDLALVLRSGALPAKVVYLEERTIGPSLGADSIKSGVTASIAGLFAVMAFMLWYYRLSGVNAVLALLLNLVLLMAALVAFNATLTLPGIAGVILTIGMAVDSNVLIFERIREEMRNGRAVATSVDLGFGKAFLTIIDTHVTTIVSAIFLFVFGTGSIRGFAVTLVVGLLANLFTAVFVSRTIFMWHLNREARVETISI